MCISINIDTSTANKNNDNLSLVENSMIGHLSVILHDVKDVYL